VKSSTNTNGIRLERGMTVDVVSKLFSNPVTTNGGQPVVDAFMRIYGIDIKRAGALNMCNDCNRCRALDAYVSNVINSNKLIIIF
jgi:hypothetical protein